MQAFENLTEQDVGNGCNKCRRLEELRVGRKKEIK